MPRSAFSDRRSPRPTRLTMGRYRCRRSWRSARRWSTASGDATAKVLEYCTKRSTWPIASELRSQRPRLIGSWATSTCCGVVTTGPSGGCGMRRRWPVTSRPSTPGPSPSRAWLQRMSVATTMPWAPSRKRCAWLRRSSFLKSMRGCGRSPDDCTCCAGTSSRHASASPRGSLPRAPFAGPPSCRCPRRCSRKSISSKAGLTRHQPPTSTRMRWRCSSATLCWEGLAARGLGLIAADQGDAPTALHWITEARDRCVRLPDAYLWVEGYCLDTLCALALDNQRAEALQWIHDLEALATRTGMRELVARAYAHRGRLGDRVAADAARVLAAEVDNPDLQRLE